MAGARLTPAIWLFLAIAALFAANAWAGPPRAAAQYQRPLTAAARYVWGIDAPIATMAAQLAQESAWKADARSPYAAGLAQFTADTASWIATVYPELANPDVFNVSWSLRALARYDRHLYERMEAADDCEKWAMVLAAYNGGPGHIAKEKRLAAAGGADPLRWWDNVERFCRRADWACKENRAYPKKIIRQHQPLYLTWGRGVC